MTIQVHHGDCRTILATMPTAFAHSCVTDPPYGLKFMAKRWDQNVPPAATWREVHRALRPGAFLFAFGGTRASHRLACAIEDAGFEIGEAFAWLFGEGMPKNMPMRRAIAKALAGQDNADAAAAEWDGWGTACKPAWEPIIFARKPLAETSIARNVLAHGTGALNIDACRIPTGDSLGGGNENADAIGAFRNEGWRRPWMDDPDARDAHAANVRDNVTKAEELGRHPANVVHDGSAEVVAEFPEARGMTRGVLRRGATTGRGVGYGSTAAGADAVAGFSDSGSAARFFYCAKATEAERADSKHPTIKPIALLRWLIRLVTPPGGTVLDPFAGSGTTGEAAMLEGFDATLIEREAQHVADIRHRIERWNGGDLPLFADAAEPDDQASLFGSAP